MIVEALAFSSWLPLHDIFSVFAVHDFFVFGNRPVPLPPKKSDDPSLMNIRGKIHCSSCLESDLPNVFMRDKKT